MSEQVGINPYLTEFEFEGLKLPVTYTETVNVAEGVTCDVYKFDGDNKKDLGIIHIQPGAKTPRQRVLTGERTIEGYVSGKGMFFIGPEPGIDVVHGVGAVPNDHFSISVERGEIMQWQAADDSKLTVFEVCYPPYAPGRYENL